MCEFEHSLIKVSALCQECTKCGMVQEFNSTYGWVTIPPTNAKDVKARHLAGGLYVSEAEKKKIIKDIKKNL